MPPPVPVPPRAAATVLIVRDGTDGLEVFMVARERQVDMATGAVVFPGGKVDPDDEAATWRDLVVPSSPERAFWLAAIRETFEESGILIAHHRSGTPVEPAAARRVTAQDRTPLLDGTLPFSTLMTRAGLKPALDLMAPFAHWITPSFAPKRFDTHFFVAAAPPGQIATHDGREAVRSFWMQPDELLAEADAGRQILVPATRLNVELLAESTTVATALASARARTIVTVMPEMSKVPEGMLLTIPKAAGYKTTEFLIRR